MRGKHIAGRVIQRLTGITPAGAGKTWNNASKPKHTRDHPRRCGENTTADILATEYIGSPPQVRGKLAGKSVAYNLMRDHPRRCGENELKRLTVKRRDGSPPQVRGKRIGEILVQRKLRITPAGAGKTLKRSFRNQPFCSRAVQISFNFSNSLNVSLQSGSAR